MSDDLNFHYQREERLAKRSAPKPRSTIGFPGGVRRRSFMLILVIIAVLLVVYGRTLSSGAGSTRLAGCRLTLHAATDADAVEAALEVEVTDASASGERLFVIFGAGETDVRLSEVLPQPGGRVVLRGRLHAAAGSGEVRADVTIGDKSAGMRRPLERAGRDGPR